MVKAIRIKTLEEVKAMVEAGTAFPLSPKDICEPYSDAEYFYAEKSDGTTLGEISSRMTGETLEVVFHDTNDPKIPFQVKGDYCPNCQCPWVAAAFVAETFDTNE